MSRTKRKPAAHIIGERAVKLVKNMLPEEWSIRELVPDYGIDLNVELFEKTKSKDKGVDTYDTLGEHLFVQVKGSELIKTQKLTVKPRYNVEIKPVSEKLHSPSENHEIEVAVFKIDTPELVTVQRIGAAVPVLLFLVDVSNNRIFFVCLTDYIDKILLPNDPNYSDKKHKTIYVPIKNEITANKNSLGALRFYAKRSKFYAAFQKFSYQKGRLDYVYDESLIETAQYFAKILLRYDFWTQEPLWYPMRTAHEQLVNLVNSGRPQIFSHSKTGAEDDKDEEENAWSTPFSANRLYTRKETRTFMEIRILWDQLENLGAMFEEICREWSIPSSLGVSTSDL